MPGFHPQRFWFYWSGIRLGNQGFKSYPGDSNAQKFWRHCSRELGHRWEMGCLPLLLSRAFPDQIVSRIKGLSTDHVSLYSFHLPQEEIPSVEGFNTAELDFDQIPPKMRRLALGPRRVLKLQMSFQQVLLHSSSKFCSSPTFSPEIILGHHSGSTDFSSFDFSKHFLPWG